MGTMRLLSGQGFLSDPPLAFLFAHHGEMLVFGFLVPLLFSERYLGALAFPLHPSVHLMPFLVAGGAALKFIAWATGATYLDSLGPLLILLGVVLPLYLLYAVGRRSARPLISWYMMAAALAVLAAGLINLSTSPLGDPGLPPPL